MNIWGESLSVMGIGLVMVFLGLIILIAFVYLLAAIFSDHKKAAEARRSPRERAGSRSRARPGSRSGSVCGHRPAGGGRHRRRRRRHGRQWQAARHPLDPPRSRLEARRARRAGLPLLIKFPRP